MIRAVIFDFNGVLVDDESLHFSLFRDVLAEQGVAIDEHDYHERFLGLDDRGCFEAALAESGKPAGPALLDELIARKASRYLEAAEGGLRYYPGAAEVVSALAKRWPLAMYSGALLPEIELALGKMGVRDAIAAIVSAEDTTRCKPDPQGYLLALDALRARPGLADLDAADCLVIEDSLAGIASAKGAGMKAVGVAQTYKLEELAESGADGVIATTAEFTPDWIDRNFGPPIGLLLARDLFFTSKITGTARALGHKVVVFGDRDKALASMSGRKPAVVFVDLAAGELVSPEAIARYRRSAGPGVPFVAFGSHVDKQALAGATEAGCDEVMPRSRFTAELPALIARYFAPGGSN